MLNRVLLALVVGLVSLMILTKVLANSAAAGGPGTAAVAQSARVASAGATAPRPLSPGLVPITAPPAAAGDPAPVASKETVEPGTADSGPMTVPAGIEALTVNDLGSRLRAGGGPTITLLYGVQCSLSRKVFPQFAKLSREYAAGGVKFQAFSTDESPENVRAIPGFLREHNAAVAPAWIRPWKSGELTQALAPIGVTIGSPWTRPLLIVQDETGKVLASAEGVTDLTPLETALQQLMAAHP